MIDYFLSWFYSARQKAYLNDLREELLELDKCYNIDENDYYNIEELENSYSRQIKLKNALDFLGDKWVLHSNNKIHKIVE